MTEGRRIFRVVLTSTGFLNFCHKFCPALSESLENRNKACSKRAKIKCNCVCINMLHIWAYVVSPKV